MAPKPASKTALIVKKKAWLQIIAPPLFNNQPIGEIIIEEPEKAIGRRVTVSLMTLTNDPSRQNTHVSFVIKKIENNQCQTTLHGYSIIPVAVRKMMRRSRERIDDSFVTKTKDSIAVRIKPVVITRGRTKGGVLAKLRQQLRLGTIKMANKLAFIDLIQGLVAHKIQREIGQPLNKIYPIQTCELRDVHIETSEKSLKNIIMAPAEKETPRPAEQKEETPAEEEKTIPEAQESA